MNELSKKLMREPLVHFLLLGAAIFVVYSLVPKDTDGQDGKIVITQGQLASMWEGFTLTRQREPSRVEWDGLIQDRVREEVYYRHALALSLDKDDSIIRRRLQQKLEFVTDGVAVQAQPSEEDLTAYLRAHPDLFRVDPRFTFRQVFLDPKRRGEGLAREASQLLAQLNREGGKARTSSIGDAALLDQTVDAMPAREVARMFGDKFAAALSGLALGQWQGPVESAYGMHLVFLRERTEGRAATLADARDAVRREWENARRLEAKEKSYLDMLKHYTVTVEQPASMKQTVAAARVK